MTTLPTPLTSRLSLALRLPLLLAGLLASAGLAFAASAGASGIPAAANTFAIGDSDFLLNGRPLQIRCGEVHAARVPREYWRHRLQMVRAMGLNTVCAYLFWNQHEPEPGRFDWSGQADAVAFIRMAQEEGLWVILRPGPYSCAEWEMGGMPWWLLRDPQMKLRSRYAGFMEPARRYLREVGRALGALQVTRGGPILMVQVENEYGFYGDDADYLGDLRTALIEAGFDIPLFACNPVQHLRRGLRQDLFQVVNFGSDPAGGFKALRAIQPKGPLMCGEFYPGWFDTWGQPHHTGNTEKYLSDLEFMLKAGASFSIYMAHGGTTFGLWSGTDRPFKPDTSSYDYDAPISEAGWVTDKFNRTRELMGRYLQPGETLPPPPPAQPAAAVPEARADGFAPLFASLPQPRAVDRVPTLEELGQGFGCTLYRTTLPAGPAGTLSVKAAHDFAFVFLDGRRVGVMDRRQQVFKIELPARAAAARLDILVEPMGRINFGPESHDRKGLHGPVAFKPSAPASEASPTELKGWQVYSFNHDTAMLGGLRFEGVPSGQRKAAGEPGFWRIQMDITKPADTFLDVSSWGKGVAWLNGRCLGRFWNIGPTQTMFAPGAWLKPGANELVILDLLGPSVPRVAGLAKPVLDSLRPELDFAPARRPKVALALGGLSPTHEGVFAPGAALQEVRFGSQATGRFFALEAVDAHDGKAHAAIAELDLLGPDLQPLSHDGWTVAHVDSEEFAKSDGTAENAIDGQTANHWHTRWTGGTDPWPHRLVLDLGATRTIAGFRYVPRQGGANAAGRIKNYRVFVGDALVVRASDAAPQATLPASASSLAAASNPTPAAAATTSPAPRPNVIFILCDDLGFGDTGPSHQNGRAAKNDPRTPAFRTPELDRVAADGLILRDHYSPAPVCAPSRASLLLGVHQGHSNVRDNQFDKALADNHTLASVLRQAGYATAAFGKWGLQGKVAGRAGDGAGKVKGKNKNKNRDAVAQKDKGNRAAAGTGDAATGGGEEGGAGDVGTPVTWTAYPTRRGFDFFHGYVRHGDGHQHYPKENGKQVWENDREITSQLDGCYTTDLFTARAKKWIVDQVAAKPGSPFFIYLAYDTPHAILQNPPCAYPAGGGLRGGLQWLGKPGAMINTANGTIDGWMHPDIAAQTWDHDGRPDTPPVPWPDVQKRYANGVRRIDQAVGDLRTLLRDLGIDRNTLIVFTSDNGPSKESYLKEAYDPIFFEGFGPFSGIKRDVLEGGLREPTFVVWPSHVPAGRTIRQPSGFWDWMPTFAELAGLPAPAASDGVSLVPTLTGVGTQRPSTIYVEYFNNQRTPPYAAFPEALRGRTRAQMQMIRVGDRSAVRYQIKSADDAFSLYDVAGDARQARPLALDAAQQRALQARVLQVRRPDRDAPRPYDDTPVPAAEISGLVPGGIAVALYSGEWPWVPDFRTLRAVRTATVSAVDATVFASGAENGAAFQGYFHAPVTGDYAFRVASDGGATLFLHEARVIDDDYRRTGTPVTGTIRLAAGWHPLRLYTRHNSVPAARRLELSLAGPGAKTFAPIPAEQLAPAVR